MKKNLFANLIAISTIPVLAASQAFAAVYNGKSKTSRTAVTSHHCWYPRITITHLAP